MYKEMLGFLMIQATEVSILKELQNTFCISSGAMVFQSKVKYIKTYPLS